MDQQGSGISTWTVRVTSFGGLASVGITAAFRRTRDGLVIFRSPWDIVVITLALIGFGGVPIYLIGADGVELLLAGDFGGDRVFVAISTPCILVVAFLFIKSSVLSRPRATVSRITRTVDYLHRGYDQQRIEASRIKAISINLREGSSAGPNLARDKAYAVTLSLSGNEDVDIATFRRERKAEGLAAALAATLSIKGC